VSFDGGGKIHTACLKGICHHFIHIHDSRSYIKSKKGLREQGMYFELEKWRERRRIWKKIVIFTLVNNFLLLSQNVHEISCF
jgi:hypothetical protein